MDIVFSEKMEIAVRHQEYLYKCSSLPILYLSHIVVNER